MLKTYHRIFFLWQHEKEEQWINRMSEMGFSLVDVGLFHYSFIEGTPNEYRYRLEMLPHFPAHKKSQDYIHFVEDTGAECIGTVKNWVYFRKKSSEGEFELFSDQSDAIQHFRRIRTWILCAMVLLLGIIATIIYHAHKAIVPYPVATIIEVDGCDFLIAVKEPEDYPELTFPCLKSDAPCTIKKTDIPVVNRLPFHLQNSHLTILPLSDYQYETFSPWNVSENADSYVLRVNREYIHEQISPNGSLYVLLGCLYLPFFLLIIYGLVQNCMQISYLKKERRIHE